LLLSYSKSDSIIIYFGHKIICVTTAQINKPTLKYIQAVPKVMRIFFSNSCISVDYWSFFNAVLIESATNGLSKTGLNLKIDQAVPQVMGEMSQTPPKQCLWENSVFLYGASNYRTFGAHKLLTAHAQSEF